MLSRVVGFGTTLAIVVTLVGTNFVSAQGQPATPAPTSGQVFRAKQVIGSQVHIDGEASVGTVDDIVIDDHGNVDYLLVINADNKLVTVPWDAAAFNAEKRIATVRIAPKVYQQIPTYTSQQYPAFATPTYRTQIYKHYGLTPGQERRAVRRGAVITTP